MVDPALLVRIRMDAKRIREHGDRTGPLENKPLRWEGCTTNPNGWRLMGDLADDLDAIAEHLERSLDDLK